MLTMKFRADRILIDECEESVNQDRLVELNPNDEPEVSVLFTNEKHARSALRLAGALAQDLSARINLVVVKEVPLAFPVDQPPVAVSFTVQRLLEFASEGEQGPLDTTVQLCYCRNKPQAMAQVLKPRSLVIIGGRKRWWRREEDRLAKLLRAKGHQVIFPTDK